MHCPPDNELENFLLGHLSDEQSDVVASHVDTCATCESTLEELEKRSDPVLDVVRSAVGAEDSDHTPQFGRLRDRLIGLPNSFSGRDTQTGPSQASVNSHSPSLPAVIGRYELLELIGRGGMGAVYRARHLKLDREVAIKVLPDHMLRSPDAVARFEREMRSVGALQHPNIVHATDAAEVEGTHFIVMELVNGMDVSALVQSAGQLSVADSCEIIRQAAIGLQHAHEQGFVHRDVKPSNLLLSKEGTVKLLDLGLARINSEVGPADELTSTSQVMGTIDYMAPEQADNSHEVDARADIYSLGATLFRLLTGMAPLDTHGCTTKFQKLTALLHVEPPDASSHRQDLPDGLVQLLNSMLSRSPDSRPVSAGDVASRLAMFCTGSSVAKLATEIEVPAAGVDTATNDPLAGTQVDSAQSGVPMRPNTAKQTHSKVGGSTAEARKITATEPLVAAPTDGNWTVRPYLVAAGVAIVLVLGVIIRIATDVGDVEIKIADDIADEITVNILRDGEPAIEGWTVSSNGETRRIATGVISVDLNESQADQFEVDFEKDQTQLSRNGKVVVTIRRIHRRQIVTDPFGEEIPGLKFYWPMNDGTGTKASGLGVDQAEFAGSSDGPEWSTDSAPTAYENPYALEFDGVDDSLDVGEFFDPNDPGHSQLFTGQSTLSMWFKTSVADREMALVGFVNTESSDLFEVKLHRDWSGTPEVESYPLSFHLRDKVRTRHYLTTSSDDQTLCDGSWHHLAFVWDDQRGPNIWWYIDGVEVQPDRITGGTKGWPHDFQPLETSLEIGIQKGVKDGVLKRSLPFKGLIDEVRIYHRPLTRAEVSKLAARRKRDRSANIDSGVSVNAQQFSGGRLVCRS